ncbi:hypothetical protein LR48_Vigan05g045100 [Vigna angularis]|uniref:Uncharacterized protein n=1 Tax=Phaseolus angularis TaxID=3914 RepID=A0A0L9UJU5_PHAAN|nr:hypothetical protein LR48_Vigan05g045100 [Vigna angularis]
MGNESHKPGRSVEDGEAKRERLRFRLQKLRCGRCIRLWGVRIRIRCRALLDSVPARFIFLPCFLHLFFFMLTWLVVCFVGVNNIEDMRDEGVVNKVVREVSMNVVQVIVDLSGALVKVAKVVEV